MVRAVLGKEVSMFRGRRIRRFRSRLRHRRGFVGRRSGARRVRRMRRSLRPMRIGFRF